MKKSAILIISLFLICCIVDQSSFSKASPSTLKNIDSYGTILLNPSTSSLNFKTQLNAWGPGYPLWPAIITQMSKFDIVATDFSIKEYTSQVKSLNPSTKILGYKDVLYENNQMDDWAVANANESWFIHDTSGNRVVNSNGGYAMNISNQGWRAHILSYVKSFDSYAFDGVFLDDVWSNFWTDSWTVNSSKIYPFPTWYTDMQSLIAYVKAGVGSKIIIANSPSNGGYVDAGNGKVGENFLNMNGAWTDINALSSISTREKFYLAWASGIDTQDNMLYYLSGFLLGLNGTNAYFGWNNVWSNSEGYYPVFDKVKQLGYPSGSYYSYQSVYSRDFANGKILFNPTGNTYTINLQGNYVTLDGTNLTVLTIKGNSGAILLKR